MKKIFKIFRRDLRNIRKNPAALAIVIGLCIIPSLYAWINIKACWDPYVNTGNLPVAVVNNDKGAVVNGKEANVGNEIIDELKKDNNIGWQFVDSWQGNYGLNEGKYYAMIEIPSNFSEGLTSLTTGNPQKPDIIYKVNEKTNAIANKITDVAKDEVTKEIKSNFVDTVNKEAFDLLNQLGGKLETNKPEILQIRNTLESANSSLKEIQDFVQKANGDSKNLSTYLASVKSDLPKVTEQINNLQNTVEASKSLITSTQQTVSSVSNSFSGDVITMQSMNQELQSLLTKLKELSAAMDNSKMIETIDKLIASTDSLNKVITSNIEALEKINAVKPNSAISDLINKLNKTKDLVTNEREQLVALKTALSNNESKENIAKAIDSISNVSNEISSSLVTVSNNFYSNGMPALNTIGDSLKGGLDTANSVLETTKIVIPQLNALATFGIASSDVASQQADQITSKLSEFQDAISQLIEKTSGLTEENLNNIIDIMSKNPDEIASFISAPVSVKKEDVYDAGIFGVGLTPFYTVLAIWVGSLLLTSLLTAECEDFEDGTKLNFLQKHFGKMLLFLLISLIQSIIIVLGDIFILGVNPVNMPLMFGFAIISSIVFTVIIFTLVSLFGNIGKAIAIVIMVFQVAGAGGIYPIQTNPKIFEVLQPLWPFTYAIDGFREAIAGPIWDAVVKDIKALGVFFVIFLVLCVLKKPFHKITEFVDHKFRESGL
ncbi:YhgE/Pip domain-containing protein [Clostridium sp. LIBA-8841]|uniref:YhgE/Pip domain-containing protein n=1 Tax=Clostridium sp. LIBA-8841 TaxID=2987530 RepID=UPI002AC38571|nr:YhgE/Pip domain-containing protein [Clostridium sp. LIBA-8841]MDZ5254788.1 YhgE/Pip domain-containing protein [Clostridium sp. LIBA-8841]